MKKKILIIVLALIILLSFSFAVFTFFKIKEIKKNDNQTAHSVCDTCLQQQNYFPKDLLISKKTLNENPEWYKSITAEYPIGEFPGVNDVKDFVLKEMNIDCLNDEDKVSKEEAEQDDVSYSSYLCSLNISYSFSNSRTLITHRLDEYGFYGGAHGTNNVVTFTYDFFGKKFNLGDLTIDENISKNFFGDEIKKYLTNKKTSDILIEEILKNYFTYSLPFVVSNEGITLILTEEIGISHSNGEEDIFIPYSELKGILKPEYLP
ncbi:MAG TPA: hypothetical protein PLO44_01020 [Candidatus Paceibacterota bacterium]|nr:hypothetical protein [Candidatus Paceibacterota bacterium]